MAKRGGDVYSTKVEFGVGKMTTRFLRKPRKNRATRNARRPRRSITRARSPRIGRKGVFENSFLRPGVFIPSTLPRRRPGRRFLVFFNLTPLTRPPRYSAGSPPSGDERFVAASLDQEHASVGAHEPEDVREDREEGWRPRVALRHRGTRTLREGPRQQEVCALAAAYA